MWRARRSRRGDCVRSGARRQAAHRIPRLSFPGAPDRVGFAAEEALSSGGLSPHRILRPQLIDLLKQGLGVLNCLLAQTDLLDEKFSPGADHVVSLLGFLSVFHVNHPLSSISYGKFDFGGIRSICGRSSAGTALRSSHCEHERSPGRVRALWRDGEQSPRQSWASYQCTNVNRNNIAAPISVAVIDAA